MDLHQLPFLHNSFEHLPNSYICLLQMGWEHCVPGYSYTNYRDMYLIHVVRSGKGTLQTGDQTYHLQKNDAFLCRPLQKVVYTADQDDPWMYYYFAFNGMFAAKLIEMTVFKDGETVISLNNTQIFDMIVEAAEGVESCRTVELYGLQQLFRFLEQFSEKDKPLSDTTSVSYQYVVRAQKYIQQNYARTIQISEIAKYLNINRSHLCRMFQKYTGSSVQAYITDWRIQQAKTLLVNTQKSIGEIATEVGFFSYSTFTTHFKQYTNMTPREYRSGNQWTLINQKTVFTKTDEGSPETDA